MDLFRLKNYKDIICLTAKERKRQYGQRFSLAKVATACGVQKTYLSKILNSDAHLNADQLAAACEFLNCSEDEIEYALLLRERETALHRFRLKNIDSRIDVLQAKVRRTSSVLTDSLPIADPSVSWIYYTDVHMQLTHLFLTIPAFQDDLSKIEKSLGVSRDRMKEVLIQLERCGLVKFDGKHYRSIEFNFHLDPGSSVYRPYRFIQRIKSLEKIDRMQDDPFCYAMTAVFAADKKCYEAVKAQIMTLVKHAQKSAIAAKSENVFQLNLDFFRWDD